MSSLFVLTDGGRGFLRRYARMRAPPPPQRSEFQYYIKLIFRHGMTIIIIYSDLYFQLRFG
jgi:hypothetical protein